MKERNDRRNRIDEGEERMKERNEWRDRMNERAILYDCSRQQPSGVQIRQPGIR
jgi:hypothetical protein